MTTWQRTMLPDMHGLNPNATKTNGYPMTTWQRTVLHVLDSKGLSWGAA